MCLIYFADFSEYPEDTPVTEGKVLEMCVSNSAKLAGQHNVANQRIKVCSCRIKHTHICKVKYNVYNIITRVIRRARA